MTNLATAPPPGQGIPAGWYADPYDAGWNRYWDGFQWTDKTNRAGIGAAPFIIAVLLPLGGIIWGIVLLAQNKIGSGMAVIGTAIVAFLVWLSLLASVAPAQAAVQPHYLSKAKAQQVTRHVARWYFNRTPATSYGTGDCDRISASTLDCDAFLYDDTTTCSLQVEVWSTGHGIRWSVLETDCHPTDQDRPY